MTTLSAPYRFVPLSPLVITPDWADQVSHDVPFEDGLCGELAITLTTHTPLCVGGEQDKIEGKPAKVRFFRAPDGQLAIPGSSLKGMLRNVMEIATFAHFREVEDQKLGVRDISKTKNFYLEAANPAAVQAGWLSFGDGRWQIRPCGLSRLHQRELIKALELDEKNWKYAKSVESRYKLVGYGRRIRFHTEKIKNSTQSLAIPNQNAELEGVVIMTGQPGAVFDANKYAKKYEFVFHAGQENVPLPIDDNVASGFRRIYEDSDDWKYWLKRLEQGQLEHGIPVFFHKDMKGSVKSMGLSMLYKLPYTYSVHDAIGHTSKTHLEDDSLDLPDLIFGRLRESGKSLRGRVQLNTALASDSLSASFTQPTVLNAPKAGYYPTYISQRNAKKFNQLMMADAELAGWKRYPVKKEDILDPPEKSGSSVQVQLETVPPKSRFQFKLRFHNLRPVELGALIWCLDFGGKPDLAHALGMGKPYGLGQVSLKIEEDTCHIRFNQPDVAIDSISDVLAASRIQFVESMNSALRSSGMTTNWEDTSPIQALMDYSAENSTDALEYLPGPKDYASVKTTQNPADVAAQFHSYTPVAAGSSAIAAMTSPAAGLDSAVEKIREFRAQEAAKAEHLERRAQASPHEQLLMDLEEILKDATSESLNGTQKKGIGRDLRALGEYVDHKDLDSAQIERLRIVMDAADALDVKDISKAVRQLRKRLEMAGY